MLETDALTNLLNRRAIDRLAERELRRRDGQPLGILLIDVDDFKRINERHSLLGGDKVLVDLARVLSASIRSSDFLGRIGGEEFMVVAPQTDLEAVMKLAERIRTSVEQAEFSYQGEAISVRVSIGAAVIGAGKETDYNSLKHWASAALAEAKRIGKGR
jgi:diguanylate cyclase (GGDEF)-like protein